MGLLLIVIKTVFLLISDGLLISEMKMPEDLLQEIFLKVYLNLNDFDPDLKFSSWIYAIARNQVVSQHTAK